MIYTALFVMLFGVVRRIILSYNNWKGSIHAVKLTFRFLTQDIQVIVFFVFGMCW